MVISTQISNLSQVKYRHKLTYWPTFFQQYKQTIEDGTRFQGSPIAGVVSEKWQMFLIRASNFWAEAERSSVFAIWADAENVLRIFFYLYAMYHLMTLLMWKLFWNRNQQELLIFTNRDVSCNKKTIVNVIQNFP